MAEPKHITWVVSNGLAVVRFRYERFRALEEYEEIDEEVNSAAAAEGVRAVVVNCDVLENFPSRLLGILAGLSKKLSKDGRKLAVCRLRPEPLRVFRLTRLDTLIPVYAGEDEARAALGA